MNEQYLIYVREDSGQVIPRPGYKIATWPNGSAVSRPGLALLPGRIYTTVPDRAEDDTTEFLQDQIEHGFARLLVEEEKCAWAYADGSPDIEATDLTRLNALLVRISESRAAFGRQVPPDEYASLRESLVKHQQEGNAKLQSNVTYDPDTSSLVTGTDVGPPIPSTFPAGETITADLRRSTDLPYDTFYVSTKRVVTAKEVRVTSEHQYPFSIGETNISVTSSICLVVPLWYGSAKGIDSLGFSIGEEPYFFGVETDFPIYSAMEQIGAALNARNQAHHLLNPFDALSVNEPTAGTLLVPAVYPMRDMVLSKAYTSQEINTIYSGMADGATGAHWRTDSKQGVRLYQHPKSSHYIRLPADSEEDSTLWLETLTGRQNLDGALGCLVIASALAQEIERDPSQRITGLRFDLADIGKKVGFDPRSGDDTAALRERVYSWFLFLTRAQVVGQRSVPYFDKKTKKEIPTQIEAPMIQIMETQRPVLDQQTLYGSAPVTMHVALSPAWRVMLCDPNLRQYLPCAEQIASIKPKQPGGAWARSIGVGLLGYWRRKVEESRMPTRRELLALPPTKSPPSEIFRSTNPSRAAEYWHKALRELVDRKLIADAGEAKRTSEAQLKDLPRENWGERWLDETVDIRPHADVRGAMDRIEKNKYDPRPRELAVPKRSGRPRKQP